MDLENIFMGKILVVDLNQGSCEEEELTEERLVHLNRLAQIKFAPGEALNQDQDGLELNMSPRQQSMQRQREEQRF